MVGLIADIDIDSDKLRSLGQLRFTIYSVLRIMTKRSYKIKIDLFDNENNLLSSNTGKDPLRVGYTAQKNLGIIICCGIWSQLYILENFWAVCFGVAPYIDRETHIFPKCTNNRGLHMVSLQHNMSRTEFIPFWGHVEAGTHLDLTCPFLDHQKVHRAEVKILLWTRVSTFWSTFVCWEYVQHIQEKVTLIHLSQILRSILGGMISFQKIMWRR